MNAIFGIILIILMFVSFIMGSYFDTVDSADTANTVNTFKNTKINNFIIILFRFIIPAIAIIIFYLNIQGIQGM